LVALFAVGAGESTTAALTGAVGALCGGTTATFAA
jgi:hypothetical protein